MDAHRIERLLAARKPGQERERLTAHGAERLLARATSAKRASAGAIQQDRAMQLVSQALQRGTRVKAR